MVRRPFLGAIALVVALVASTAACADSGERTVALGFQGVLSGDNDQLGLNALRGIRTALAEVNEDGVLPYRLELVESDDAGSPDQGPSAAQRLIDDPAVVAVVGPMLSGATKASEPYYSEAGLLSVSPSATSPALTDLGFTTFYRVIAPDTVQGRAAADYISTVLEARKVYSLDDRTEYGTGLSTAIEAELQSDGVEIVHDGISPTKDYTAQAIEIMAEVPDVLYYSGYYAQLALLTKALRGNGFAGVIMGGDGARDPQFVEQAGADAAEGTYLSCACGDANSDPAAVDFVRSFREVNDGALPGIYSGEAYDATHAVVEILRGLGENPSRGAVAAAFAGVELDGVTKKIRFEDNGEVQGSSVFIYQVRDGRITVLGNTADLVGP